MSEGTTIDSPLSLYVLDACSLLNLLASRRFADIARGTPALLVIPDLAAVEIRFVRRGGTGADADEREPVDLGDFQADRLLVVANLDTSSELASFVAFAAQMDDGEAASCAIVVNRGGTLVTDDRKARCIMAQAFPATRLLATSEVIKAWADEARLGPNDLSHVLVDIEQRGNFRPGRNDPLEGWWNDARSLV